MLMDAPFGLVVRSAPDLERLPLWLALLVGDRGMKGIEWVAEYSVKLGVLDFGKSITTLAWMWSNSDKMSPRERFNLIDWSS